MVNKIVLAYSGGLDTSIMIKWLKEKYNCPVIACAVDVGQEDDFSLVRKRAMATGAQKVYVIDAKHEFVTDYIYRAIQSNAMYENKYLLGTSLARPIIAQKVVEIALKEKADAVSHGSTGKGNDQVRFELTFKSLAPKLKIIAPWREWDLKSRTDEIDYAKEHKIYVPVTKEKPYSSDANLWHISYEGGILENLENAPDDSMFQMTVSPEKAPNKPEYLELEFEKGVPVKLNRHPYSPVKLIDTLNRIAGRHGVGRTDVVENRLVGIKSRGVYETPAGTVLLFAHRELEALVFDRETLHYKQQYVDGKYAELIYYGLWWSQLKKSIDAFLDETQKYVTGTIKLKLYKGNISIISRKSPYSLYWEKLATFEQEDIYNQKDAEGFINLFGLQGKVESILRKKC